MERGDTSPAERLNKDFLPSFELRFFREFGSTVTSESDDARSIGQTRILYMAASGGPPQPFSIRSDGSLTVPLHVLHMPNGRLPIPNKTKEILLEIGTNAFDTVMSERTENIHSSVHDSHKPSFPSPCRCVAVGPAAAAEAP